MITRLHVQNFKSLRELEVEFGRLTVLVGANGCGKSSVLQAIKLLRDVSLAEEATQSVLPPAGAASQPLGPSDPYKPIHIRIECAPDLVIDAKPKPDDEDPGAFSYQSLTWKTDARKWSDIYLGQHVPNELSSVLHGIDLYQLDKRVMERPAYSEEAEPVMGPQGEHLATVLDAMQGFQRERFEAIEAQLATLVPGLRRVRLQRVKMPITREMIVGSEVRRVNDSVVGHQVMLDFEFVRSVSASQASEGTMLLLGLLTVIGAESGPPKTVMLDDLDRALHPKAQKQLVEHLHRLVDERPELQIIATSHSPYLVEHLAYDEVLAMTQSSVDGRSLIAPLNDHPDAERWRDEMSAGEFWSSVGEDWIERAKPQ